MLTVPTKKNKSMGINHIKVPAPNTGDEQQYYSITANSMMQKVMRKRNIRHFGQAKDTPLATTEIQNLIGWDTNTEAATDILEGTAKVGSITNDEHARLFLHQCKRRHTEVPFKLIPKKMMKMMDKYKHWKEGTSTSPSGQHLGHFYTLFKPYSVKKMSIAEQGAFND